MQKQLAIQTDKARSHCRRQNVCVNDTKSMDVLTSSAAQQTIVKLYIKPSGELKRMSGQKK